MKKSLIAGAAVVALAAPAVGVATIEAAHAGTPQFCHYSPDDGLDSAIQITVRGGYRVFVAEGLCVSNYTSNDPLAIYTPAGQEIWCKYSGTWKRAFYGGADGNTNTLSAYFNDGSGCTKRYA